MNAPCGGGSDRDRDHKGVWANHRKRWDAKPGAVVPRKRGYARPVAKRGGTRGLPKRVPQANQWKR